MFSLNLPRTANSQLIITYNCGDGVCIAVFGLFLKVKLSKRGNKVNKFASNFYYTIKKNYKRRWMIIYDMKNNKFTKNRKGMNAKLKQGKRDSNFTIKNGKIRKKREKR